MEQEITMAQIAPLPQSQALTPLDMLDRAVAQGANIDVLEKLIALNERWEATQARRAFDEAMAAAKAKIPTIRKNQHVGFDSKKSGAPRTDYRHEDLAEIARTVDPILAENGLSYRFRTSSEPNQPISVTCIVSHRLGHSEENTLMAGRDETGNKNSIQAIGSTITYLQRYTLKAALGLAAAADDDGAGADSTMITEVQVEELIALADAVKADKEKFCKFLRVDSIAAIPARDFARAKQALEAKKTMPAKQGAAS